MKEDKYLKIKINETPRVYCKNCKWKSGIEDCRIYNEYTGTFVDNKRMALNYQGFCNKYTKEEENAKI